MEQTHNIVNDNEVATFEASLKRFGASFARGLPTLCAILIAIWWVFYGTVSVEQVNLSLTERIGITICTVVLAVVYSGMIANGGFANAKTRPEWRTQSLEWTNAIKEGAVYKKEIELFARDIAKENQKAIRTANLEANELNYDDYFDEQGNLYYYNFMEERKSKTNPTGLTRKQIKIIRKCINTRVILPTLFGNLSSRFFGIKKEQTQKEYETKTGLLNFVIRFVLSVFSVGFIFTFIGFNISSVIYAFFQIVLWTASGVSQRIKNYNFVIQKLLPQMVEKTLIISSFLKLDEATKEEYKRRVIEEKNNKKLKRLTYGGQQNA